MKNSVSQWESSLPPDHSAFEEIVMHAIEGLPVQFRQQAAAVALQVADFAPDTFLEELDLENPFDLTGLYTGIPMTEKSVMDQPMEPDTIWLFRRPILDEWVARGDIELGVLVAHVFIHELAHHFGWSDADIATIAPWQD
ncbi:metallopeptidase family protein [Roseinatronobacter sp.]